MSKRDATQFTHWRRPACRMYQYNYEVAESYYKPQVKYIETGGTARRRFGPPGAQTFMERWAADPFYGRTESLGELCNRGLIRASSLPRLLNGGDYFVRDVRNAAEDIRQSRSRCRSVSRERSVVAEESSRNIRARSRSISRSRSPSPPGLRYASSANLNDERVIRRSRERSLARWPQDIDSYIEDQWIKNRDLDDLVQMARREERESSIFNMRQALDDPRTAALRKPMKTTVGLGFYANSLYGTEVWAPSTYREKRRVRYY